MPRRVPVPALRPLLTQCKPTGVTLTADSRVVVALDEGGVGKALSKKLSKLGVVVLPLEVALSPEQVTAQVQEWLTAGPVQGVYWLPALDVEPEMTAMSRDEWQEANWRRVKNLALVMRVLYEAVSTADSFLVAGTRLGGLHGYGPEPAIAPLGGGVTGFTKAYKRERPLALVKAVDFAAQGKADVLADKLMGETVADPGCVEVGYWRNGRYTITLQEQPADYSHPALTLNRDTVFLVTGAAGGITSAIVADLAAASGGVFYLLDVTPAPDPADAQIQLFRSDREALKQQLVAEMRAAGQKVLPPMIEKALTAVERREAALQAVEAVQRVGGTAVYRSVNLLDHQAIGAVVAEIGQAYGRIDVLIHAGGVEISKALDQKGAAQFDLVYDIKANGFYSLLHAARPLPIGATVVFSSVAGRFGNAGQTDYSAANDLLCKLTSHLHRIRPQTKAIAIDWTAWGGIGMATRGSIPKIMEMAGIEMLPPAAGIPTTRRELLAGGGEVLVGGKLGLLVDEWDESGGLAMPDASAAGLLGGSLMAAQVYGGWTAEWVLDPQVQPFLHDHALEGTPLLPGVMGTELFAQLAQMMAPDWRVTAVTDVQFHAPFKFYRMESQRLYFRATAVLDGEELLVQAALDSRRNVKAGVQEKLHFTATVRMAAKAVKAPKVKFNAPVETALDIAAADIYNIYFHGPAYQVLAAAQVDGARAVGLWASSLPPNMNPADAPELMAPRLIELCFQTAGVWQIRTQQTMALPLALGSVVVYKQEREANGRRLYAIVEAVNGGEAFNAQVVDGKGQVFLALTGYRTIALPGDVRL